MTTITPLAIAEVLLITPKRHGDARGWFAETWSRKALAAGGISPQFVQDNQAFSARKGTLRGLHFQKAPSAQGKLVRVLKGSIFDVAVDIRRSSPHFGKWIGVTLEAGDGRQLWIPPGFAHGFYVLSESADVSYKCTTVYHAESNRSIRWDDPSIAIRWPVTAGTAPLLSPKDAAAATLESARWFE